MRRLAALLTFVLGVLSVSGAMLPELPVRADPDQATQRRLVVFEAVNKPG